MGKKFKLNEKSFTKLFLKHENAFRAFARSMLPNWDSVDDVLQKASAVMWTKQEQLNDESGFLPWGKVIVRIQSLKYIQKIKSEKIIFSEKTLNVIADTASKDEEEDYAFKQNALRKCLQKLTKTQRNLIMAPYYQHGSIKVLANNNNVSVNSLYKKLGRLREKLSLCIRSQRRNVT
jgi:RNA polymerase sigma-70 factor (ECF subfamily)